MKTYIQVAIRQQKDWIKVDDHVKNKGTLISTCDFSSVCGLKNIFESYEKLKQIYYENVSISEHRFWQTSGLFSAHEDPHPNWSGYMQNILKGSHQLKSKDITSLILNMNPNNETCIYSINAKKEI